MVLFSFARMFQTCLSLREFYVFAVPLRSGIKLQTNFYLRGNKKEFGSVNFDTSIYTMELEDGSRLQKLYIALLLQLCLNHRSGKSDVETGVSPRTML